MKRWLAEPFLHFLLAGGLLFAAYAWRNRHEMAATDDPRLQVHVTAGDVTWLAETWSRQWMRPPTPEELHGLVQEFLKEQLLAREAQELGMAENDTIVRRRLAQKLDFLLRDTARLAQPTEADLLGFHEAHPELFKTEPRVSFTQIFFSRERRADAAGDARAALVQLQRADTAPEILGDPLLIEPDIEPVTVAALAAQWGDDFARSVVALTPGTWCGPIESGFGLHLVHVSDVQPAQLRDFADARPQVLQRWLDAQERDADSRYVASLMQKYDVVVDESVRALVGTLQVPETPRP